MIVICDDDHAIRQALSMVLRSKGYSVDDCGPGEVFSKLNDTTELLLLDLYLGNQSGLDILKKLQDENVDFPIVMISGQAGLSEAMEAVRLGARDFLEKPVTTERLLVSVQNAVQSRLLAQAHRNTHYPVVHSKGLKRSLELLARAANSVASVLIQGESGTGKDAAAHYIHSLSTRANKPLVRINCGAIPESLIESELFGHMKGSFTGAISDFPGKLASAHGGTLFLDEVGDLPPGAQTKFLRFLEDGEIQKIGSNQLIKYDVRVISATHKDLEKEASEGRFRMDLVYRLRILPVKIPPLRERLEDILPLIDYFLLNQKGDMASVRLFTEDARKFLLSYPWPGNVRELRSLCERLAVWIDDFPLDAVKLKPILGETTLDEDPFLQTLPLAEAKRRLELRYLKTQLEKFGSVKATAEALGILANNFSRRLGELEDQNNSGKITE